MNYELIVRYDIKTLLIFAAFLLPVNFELCAWELRVYHASSAQPKIPIETVKPFDLYASKINKLFFKTEEMPCRFYSEEISISYGQLKKLAGANNCVHIFVVPGKFRGKAGQLKTKNNEIVRYVFVRENCPLEEICHELCHAVAGLGDEYGDSGNFPENMKKPEGKTIYPNLTWYESGFEAWREMVSAEKYFSGGAGYGNGIFHAYENCLMKELSWPLCPVCSFYLQRALDEDLP